MLTKQNLSFWTLTQQRRRLRRERFTLPPISFSRSNVEFGDVLVSDTETVQLRLTNKKGSTVNVTAINVGGANAADFSHNVSLPLAVSNGTFANLALQFTPSAPGIESATFAIVTDAGTFNFYTRGTGV